jgi:hypothetical protein
MTDTLNGAAWLSLLERFGLPTVLVGFLLWVIFFGPARTDATNAAALQQSVNALSSVMNAHVDASHQINAEMLWYMRAICVNNASDIEERRLCIPPKDLVESAGR